MICEIAKLSGGKMKERVVGHKLGTPYCNIYLEKERRQEEAKHMLALCFGGENY